MHRLGRSLAFALALIAPIPIAAGAAPAPGRPVVAPGPGARMDSLLQRYSDYGYAGVALVEHRGRIVLHRAYGLADRARGITNRIDTRFAIASITKSFTAAALMRMADRSAIHTDDSLGRFFEDLPHETARITLEQLLTHTSGLPVDAEDQELDTRTAAATATSLARVRLRFAPGTDRLYSNFGYNVLARVIERVAGRPFERWVTDSLIAQAGLRQTAFPAVAGAAIARGHAGPVEALAPTSPPPTDAHLGAGSLLSTAADLHRWLVALREGRVVPPAVWETMIRDTTGETAYGWLRGRTSWGTPAVTAGGDWDGYHADIYWFPDDSVTVTLTTNVSPNTFRWDSAVIRGIMRILRGREVVLPPQVARGDSNALARYAGRYRFASGATFDVSRKGGALFVGAAGQAAVNHLAWPNRVPPADVERCNALADSFVAALAGKDSAYLAPRCETPEIATSVGGWWQSRIDSTDAVKGRTVLGTAPKGPAKLETFVRVDTGRGEPAVVRLVWRVGTLRLTAIGLGIPLPATTLFLPEGEGRFAGYDPPTDQVVRIAFDPGASGVTRGLTVATAAGGQPAGAVRER